MSESIRSNAEAIRDGDLYYLHSPLAAVIIEQTAEMARELRNMRLGHAPIAFGTGCKCLRWTADCPDAARLDRLLALLVGPRA